LRSAIIAAAATLVLGCSDTTILSGAFLSTYPLVFPEAPGLNGKYVELVLGHYGPDVAGLVFVCSDRDCTDRTDCAHIERGHWSGETLTFAFSPPKGCSANQECLTLARLSLEGEDKLLGVFSADNAATPELALVRKKHAGDLVPEDLNCHQEAQP